MRLALLHNPKPPGTHSGDEFEEYDDPETIAAIAGALTRMGHSVEPVVADRDLPFRLMAARCDFVFNIAEGAGRRCREAVPAAVCELLGLPYTGSDPLTLAVTLDKAVARRVVSPDVPVAPAILVTGAPDEGELAALAFPVIVKPNDEGSSKGIRRDSVAANPAEAAARCRWLAQHYGCPVLVEQFLPGAEVTVGLLGPTGDPRVAGMMEIAPRAAETAFVYSLEVKRDYERVVRYHIPPRLAAETIAGIAALARTTYRLLGCRDVARVDFRLDGAGRPHLLEVNPLPGLHPRHSDLVIMTRAAMPYDDLVRAIWLEAARRVGVAG